MNEIEYRELCKACDEVLIEQLDRKVVISISWLHVLREHPIFLKRYQPKKSISYVFDFFLGLGIIFYELVSSLFNQEYYRYINVVNRKPIKVLFLSHFLNSNSIAPFDFYFGNIPNQYDSSILKINHTTKSFNIDAKDGIVLPRRLNFFGELRLIFDVLYESIRLLKISLSKKGLASRVYRRAAFEVISSDTLSTLRLRVLVMKALATMMPKMIITTFEGHAWERIVFSLANEMDDKNITSVGYQHAALFRMQHSIYRSLGAKYDPKVILSAGEIGHNQMIQKSQLTSRIGGVLGSNRAIFQSNFNQNLQKNKILVIPEGIIEDCVDLFSFTLECAKAYPQLKFIWRVHPLINFQDLFSKFNYLGKHPSNVLISEEIFEYDLSRSKFALFRGSTAIISAVANGVIPFYFAKGKEFMVNPIYEIDDHYFSVSTPVELLNAIDIARQDDVAINYCSRFYKAFDSRILDEMLNC